MDTAKTIIYNTIAAASKDQPAGREILTAKTGLGERAVRGVIEDLREQGVRVCGLSKGKGYWIAANENEYQAFRADYISKAKTIFRRTHAMDGTELDGQVSIYDAL